MTQSQPRFPARFVAILPLFLATSLAFAQTAPETSGDGETKTIEIAVDNPRPLAAAIGKLEQLSEIPINYEDMPLYYWSDLADMQRRPLPSDFDQTAFPLGGELSVQIMVDSMTGRLNNVRAVRTALTALISAYNSSDLPGDFDFEYLNGVFFVMPVRYRDGNGETKPMVPRLSATISLPEEKRSRERTLQLILEQLTRTNGIGFGGPWFAINGMQNKITFEANNEPAHHVLARFWGGRVGFSPDNWDSGLSYALFCPPKPGGVDMAVS